MFLINNLWLSPSPQPSPPGREVRVRGINEWQQFIEQLLFNMLEEHKKLMHKLSNGVYPSGV